MKVFFDRFWHSTAAYAIAKETDAGVLEHLPTKDHSIYTWPNDLIFPSAVVFLKTSEINREDRVTDRKNLTKEEQKLNENKQFGRR